MLRSLNGSLDELDRLDDRLPLLSDVEAPPMVDPALVLRELVDVGGGVGEIGVT